MAHEHVWQKEPPDNRTSEDKYGDKRDMAHNSFWTSTEELQELRLQLKKDPEFENSTDWPMVVEWCSSCGETREVKLDCRGFFFKIGLWSIGWSVRPLLLFSRGRFHSFNS